MLKVRLIILRLGLAGLIVTTSLALCASYLALQQARKAAQSILAAQRRVLHDLDVSAISEQSLDYVERVGVPDTRITFRPENVTNGVACLDSNNRINAVLQCDDVHSLRLWKGNHWTVHSVIAHEVGHHIYFDLGRKRRDRELFADYLSGYYVCFQKLALATDSSDSFLGCLKVPGGIYQGNCVDLPLPLDRSDSSLKCYQGNCVDLPLPLDRSDSFLAQGQVVAPMTFGLEPNVQLDEMGDYISHLHRLRRVNLGDDNADSAGYGLYLLRVPVSIEPGDHTKKGFGAIVNLTVGHDFNKCYQGNSVDLPLPLDRSDSSLKCYQGNSVDLPLPLGSQTRLQTSTASPLQYAARATTPIKLSPPFRGSAIGRWLFGIDDYMVGLFDSGENKESIDDSHNSTRTSNELDRTWFHAALFTLVFNSFFVIPLNVWALFRLLHALLEPLTNRSSPVFRYVYELVQDWSFTIDTTLPSNRGIIAVLRLYVFLSTSLQTGQSQFPSRVAPLRC